MSSCPGFQAQQSSINALQGEVNTLQSEVAALNATVADLVGKIPKPLPPIPFNEAMCRATPIESFNTTNGFWTFTFPSRSGDFVNPCARPALMTCSEICGVTSSRCDPCAMSKLNCQNAYYYALIQAEFTGNSALFYAQMLYPDTYPQDPPGSFNWNQSTCANATFDGSSELGYRAPLDGPLVGNTTAATGVQFVCNPPSPSVRTYSYATPINFYDKTQSTWVDPTNICDAPVWVKGDVGDLYYAYLGVGCYCRY